MKDQGLERIPTEYRSRCWQMAKAERSQPWVVYKAAIMQMAFGGVSSEAEAERLFYADQLGYKTFLSENLKPSQMAEQLSTEIQESFQHHSRPISTFSEPEKQLIEIVNYYFSSEEALQNFYAALNGNLDFMVQVQEEIKPSKVTTTTVLNTEERPFVKAYLMGENTHLPENICRIIDDFYP